MIEALQSGPIIASMWADEEFLSLYIPGYVYAPDNCDPQTNPTNILGATDVVIVGYGEDPVQGKYWKVKTSLSRAFGEVIL